MINRSDKDISSIDFDTKIKPVDDLAYSYVKKHFINDYVAYFIMESYKHDITDNERFELIIKYALELLKQLTNEHCDCEIIRKILKTKYGLKLTLENPLTFKELSKYK